MLNMGMKKPKATSEATRGYCQLVEGSALYLLRAARSCPVTSRPPIVLNRRTSPHCAYRKPRPPIMYIGHY